MTSRPTGHPAPLLVAASLVAVEGLLLLGYAVLEAVNADADRLAVAVTTGTFFLLYGGGLMLCAWGLLLRHSWARSPIVLAQFIQLGVAWSFWGGDTTAVALGLALVAVVVLVGVFHPASLQALESADPDGTRD